jgi:hypothetical protein
MSKAGTTEELQQHGTLTIGARVTGPGPRPSAPRETGTLRRLYVLYTARGKGIWASVERDDGSNYSTAAGLIREA